MPRKHLFAVVVLLCAAAVAGLLALTRTTGAGATAAPATSASVAARSRALDRLEASLRRELAQRPPRLKALDHASTPVAAPPELVYVRRSAAAAAPHGEHEDHESDEHESDD